MPTSSVHIIDSLWGRRSSLDSLRDERLNWIPLTHLLIWRILCAVLERYFCNRIPLQITRRPFCYSVSDRYRAVISANLMWKCSFDIVLISPNRHHRRNFFMPKCYLTPVTQHWCCKHWKHCYIEILRCSAIWSMEFPWWNHQKRTVSALWGEPSFTGEFPHTESQQRGFIFCISLDKRLNKRSDCQWFETIRCSLWRYCYVLPNRHQRCNFLFKSYDWPLRHKIDFHTGNTAGCYRKCASLSMKFFHKHGNCILITILRYAWI